jgi:hypothetical protein
MFSEELLLHIGILSGCYLRVLYLAERVTPDVEDIKDGGSPALTSISTTARSLNTSLHIRVTAIPSSSIREYGR